jgi:glycosyltransferase involved in cell wall biosynthesis
MMIAPQFKPLIGGYERACERLSESLAGQGHQVVVLAEHRLHNWPKRESISGFEVIRWWCVYRPYLHQLTSAIGLVYQLVRARRKFHVWHVHQYCRSAVICILLGNAFNIPVVLKLTSSSYGGIEGSIKGFFTSRITKLVYKRVSAVVALTSETYQEALSFGFSQDQVHIFGNGLDTSVFAPRTEGQKSETRLQLNLPDNLYMIFVGRLASEKDLPILISAWSNVPSDLHDKWSLIIVGEGNERTLLEQLIREKSLTSTVRLVGYQSNISSWLSIASAFVLTSKREGLSNTMLEALSTGLPVITTEISGAKELVKNPGTGWVVPVGDVDALTGAFVDCMQDHQLREIMGHRARQLILRQYAIPIVAKRHENLYRTLVAEQRHECSIP